MLKWLSEKARIARISRLWSDATGLDLGDRGQVAMIASSMIKTVGMRIEDAWLSALVNWIYNNPDTIRKNILALGVLRFLDIYGSTAALSPECKSACVEVVNKIFEQDPITESAIHKSLGLPPMWDVFSPKNHPPISDKSLSELVELARLECDIDEAVPPSPPVPEVISRSEAFKLALEFLSLKLCEDGYVVQWMGKGCEDVPSLIAKKDGKIFHILLNLNFWPGNTGPANFLLERFLDDSVSESVGHCIAWVKVFNRNAKSESEKSEITSKNIDFIFPGLKHL